MQIAASLPSLTAPRLTAALVRAKFPRRDIPFVMLSGTSESVIRETFADYDAFIEKPFSPEALVQVVTALVRDGRPTRTE